jgi:hypothetical protein
MSIYIIVAGWIGVVILFVTLALLGSKDSKP